MKKIVSLVVFIAALAWTWNIINSTPAIGFETHVGIQGKLTDLIKNTIVAKRPLAKDVTINKLWTEPLTENKVRAVFSYQFTELNPETNEETFQIIDGVAELHRELSDVDGVDKWVLQSVKTTNDAVVFSEGSVITNEPATETPATTPEGTTPAGNLENKNVTPPQGSGASQKAPTTGTSGQ